MIGWNRVLKRLFDLVVGSVLLVLSAPLLLVLVLLLLRKHGRPVFFVQDRMGLDGRSFWIWKFRSMRVDAEASSGPIWAVQDDPRRTRLGSFLRRWSLDELPQLWNVLKGEMSLVGPRPERPSFVHEFKQRLLQYMVRHKVKAGITGWAQVHGWRGNTSLHERVEHDIYYIQNWTLGLDVRILLMTFWRGWAHRNAY